MSVNSWLSTSLSCTVNSNKLSIILLLGSLNAPGFFFSNSTAIATIESNLSGFNNGLTNSSTSSVRPVKACSSEIPVSLNTSCLRLFFNSVLPTGFLSIAAYLPATSCCSSITVSAISLPPILARAGSSTRFFFSKLPVATVLPVLF